MQIRSRIEPHNSLTVDLVYLHSFYLHELKRHNVLNLNYNRLYVAFKRTTVRNTDPASYSVTFTKLAATHMLRELPFITEKLDQYEKQQKQQAASSAAAFARATRRRHRPQYVRCSCRQLLRVSTRSMAAAENISHKWDRLCETAPKSCSLFSAGHAMEKAPLLPLPQMFESEL